MRGQLHSIALLRLSVLAGLLSLSLAAVAAEPRPLAHAHAHNDYEHPRPLFDALAQGFCNVEADVWLVDGRLLVAHDRAQALPGRTLEGLYLDPLRDRVRRNGGRVFPDGPPFTLMIDLKSDGTNTYLALRDLLRRYEPMLTRFHSNRTETNAVTLVISGDRPRGLMESEPSRLAAYDGRLSDLELSPHFAPWISDNWRTHFRWTGFGLLPEAERVKLRDLAARAKQRGMKLRFWGTADTPAVWRELLAAEVSLISTDQLEPFRRFADGAK